MNNLFIQTGKKKKKNPPRGNKFCKTFNFEIEDK